MLIVTIFLWAVPTSFFGIDALTVVQQRVIALFVFAALMWIFEIIPNWTTSLLVIVISLLTVSNKGIGFFCKAPAVLGGDAAVEASAGWAGSAQGPWA